LTAEDMPKHSLQTAESIASFHSMEIDNVPKEPMIFKTLYKWIDEVEKIKELKFEYSIKTIREEAKYLEDIISKFPIKFCHNDLQSRNMIHQPDEGEI
jgi:thiamine kinase-like enzyme